jgi:hypothetical protein
MSNDDTIQDFIYGDGQPDGATVREVLTLAYGDDWERQLSDVVTVGERSEMQYVTDASGFRNFRHDYFPLIVIRLTCGRSVYGYEDALEVANYRVLRDEWSDVEGLTDGPYSDSSHIALDLDKPAPTTLVETLESLRNYPSLSDDEYSTVEQEMILEHWEDPALLDSSAAEFGADVVAQWIRARLGLVVPVTGYGNRPLFIAYCNRRNLIAA